MLMAFLHRVPHERLLWYCTMGLALCTGVLLGSVWGFFLEVDAHPPVIVTDDTPTEAAAIVLEGFRDGALRGHAAGRVRLFARDQAVTIDGSGAFAITHPAFRIEEVTIVVPPGMRFVASKRGKKYYKVESAAGENIAPENRVYFPSAEAAQAAGFRP